MSAGRVVRPILVGGLMFMTACGGGGETSTESSGPAPLVVNLTSTTVTADSSVPAPVVNVIAEVVSPVASGPLSSSIPIATTESRDSFVLALDAGGKIRLTAMTSSGVTILNADSTALALVRMVIGDLPPAITASQANQAIRGAAEFPALVALIQGILNSEVGPLESGPVVESIATTTRQAMSKITVLITPTTSSTSSVAAYADKHVDPSQLPHFNILSNVSGLFSVYVSGSRHDGSVNLVNASPIVWSAHSLDERGALIRAPSPSFDGKVLLEANTVGRSLLDKVHPWLGPPAINLPGNDGKGLDIVIEQNVRSRQENLSAILKGALATILPIVGSECLGGVAAGLINANSLGEFAQATTFEFFRDGLNPTILANDDKFRNIISTCAPGLHPKGYELGTFALRVSKALTGLAVVQSFNEPATLVAKVVLTAAHWNTNRPVAACMGESGSIQNCAVKFTFENISPILAPNARFTPRITALTDRDIATGLPVGITHTASDAAQAVVTVLTPPNGERQTGELVANGVGSTTITVRDPYTDVSDQYTVTVVRPRITPGVVMLGVGQSMTLTLTDATNHAVITDGAGIRWMSSDETKVALGPFSSGSTNTATIIARAPGKVTITVTNPVLPDPIMADVEVSGISGTWSGPYSFSYQVSPCAWQYQGTLSMTILQNDTSFSGSSLQDALLVKVDGPNHCGTNGDRFTRSAAVSGTLTTTSDVTTLSGMFKICDACGGSTGTMPVTESWTATLGVAPNTMTGKWDSLSHGDAIYNSANSSLSSSFTLTKR